MKKILFTMSLIILLASFSSYAFASIQETMHTMHIAIDPVNPRGPGLTASEACNICHAESPVNPESCATCHSPNGSYDGLYDADYGAWPNREFGIYEIDGSMKPGKEKWCVSCHDEVPANSKADGSGVNAQNIAGNNSSFGFYVNGHKTVSCLNCHDADVTHIDHELRTYAFNSAYYGPSQSGVAYATGYRLRYIDENVPLMIPANYSITFGYNAGLIKSTASRLCFSCHDSSKIFDDTPGDGIDSNFKASLPNPPRNYSYAWGSGADINEHVSHILNYVFCCWDSDWDTGTNGAGGSNGCDSITACSTCHNVHGAEGSEGSTNEVMIRDGSLAGRTGYGFSYVVEDVASGGYPMVTSSGADHSSSVGAIFRNNTANMCAGSMCHNNPAPPSGASYDASGSSWGTDVEYYRVPTTSLCSTCHGEGDSHYTHLGGNEKGVNLDCSVCHGDNPPHSSALFADGELLENTTVCNTCHSQGGAINMINEAKNNWADGIYESDGITLRLGNDKWCASCHDDDPANSKADDTGIDAPNVVGNNSSYGYYVSGHRILCTECHDPSLSHIDNEQRTYVATSDNYQAGFRLKSINGAAPLEVPRSGFGGPTTYPEHFSLCFSCHDKLEILGGPLLWGDWYINPPKSNFFDNSLSRNEHYVHLGMTSAHWDSDGDGTGDSRENCTTCHNVHGSSTQAMIRDGSLIGKEPALNFCYLAPTDDVATFRWTPTLQGGTYTVEAWWSAHPNRASNAPYIVNHKYGTTDPILKNQQLDSATWNELAQFEFDPGTNGYVELSNYGANGYVMADAIRFTSATETVIIDNDDETATSWTDTWPILTTNPDQYGANEQYHGPQIECSKSAPVSESFAGRMTIGRQIFQNGVCNACHYVMTYYRTPYLGPRFLNLSDDGIPSVPLQGGQVTFRSWILCNDDTLNVSIDLGPIGGLNTQPLYDNGTYGDAVSGDYIYSYLATLLEGEIKEGMELLTLTATTPTVAETQLVLINIYDPYAIYIDNPAASYIGDWPILTSNIDQYMENEQYQAADTTGTTDNSATFTPEISVAGNYNIYVWYSAYPNRATNAPYTIHYHDAGGTPYETTVYVNQRQNGAQWLNIGNFYFIPGTGNSVVLTDDADGYVMADALKFKLEDPIPKPYPIVDNLDAWFVGDWPILTSNPDQYDGSEQYHGAGVGDYYAIFTPQVEAANVGPHNIYAWWSAHPNRATDAKYEIHYFDEFDNPLEITIEVNQEEYGTQWYYLGNFYLKGGTDNFVILSDNANEYVMADAVWFEKGDPPIVDNLDVDPSDIVGTWPLLTSNPDQYAASEQYHAKGTGLNTFTFRYPIQTGGTYKIYAWWSAHSNRGTDVPYTIYYDSVDPHEVRVNQEQNGKRWNLIATLPFAADTDARVMLSDDANEYVMADAVMFIFQP